MSDLIVTFSRARSQLDRKYEDPNYPVAYGANTRTEALAIGSESDATTLAAIAGDNYVELYSPVDCWFEIGSDPTAEAIASGEDGTSRFLPAGYIREFDIDLGDKVAVIEA